MTLQAVTQVHTQAAAGPAGSRTGIATQPKVGRAPKVPTAALAAASSSTRVDAVPATAGVHPADTTRAEEVSFTLSCPRSALVMPGACKFQP